MRTMLQGKIHRATVTGADLDYEGSITIDSDLLERAGMLAGEQVHVFNISNGDRLVTYTFAGERGGGEIVINGAAARKVSVGDKVIIVSYVLLDEERAREHKPTVIVLDDDNKIKSVH